MKNAIARERDLSAKMKEESYFRALLEKFENGELPDAQEVQQLDK